MSCQSSSFIVCQVTLRSLQCLVEAKCHIAHEEYVDHYEQAASNHPTYTEYYKIIWFGSSMSLHEHCKEHTHQILVKIIVVIKVCMLNKVYLKHFFIPNTQITHIYLWEESLPVFNSGLEFIFRV